MVANIYSNYMYVLYINTYVGILCDNGWNMLKLALPVEKGQRNPWSSIFWNGWWYRMVWRNPVQRILGAAEWLQATHVTWTEVNSANSNIFMAESCKSFNERWEKGGWCRQLDHVDRGWQLTCTRTWWEVRWSWTIVKNWHHIYLACSLVQFSCWFPPHVSELMYDCKM